MTKELLDRFETALEEILVQLCHSRGAFQGKMGETIDIDSKWDDVLSRPYIEDAVPQFNQYPEAALAWAAYLGMGVAQRWDYDWERFCKDDYAFFLGSRGWDDMDEHIVRDILKHPLHSEEAASIADTLSACATATLDAIRHSGVEPGTAEAYYVFLRSLRVMFRIGAACQLYAVGYRMTIA